MLISFVYSWLVFLILGVFGVSVPDNDASSDVHLTTREEGTGQDCPARKFHFNATTDGLLYSYFGNSGYFCPSGIYWKYWYSDFPCVSYVTHCGFQGEGNVREECVHWQRWWFSNRKQVDEVCMLWSKYIEKEWPSDIIDDWW